MDDVVHEIVTDEFGNRHGTDGKITVSLHGADGRMFKRRAIKQVGTEQSSQVCYLAVELNGVKVYQRGNNVIVTTQELNP